MFKRCEGYGPGNAKLSGDKDIQIRTFVGTIAYQLD